MKPNSTTFAFSWSLAAAAAAMFVKSRSVGVNDCVCVCTQLWELIYWRHWVLVIDKLMFCFWFHSVIIVQVQVDWIIVTATLSKERHTDSQIMANRANNPKPNGSGGSASGGAPIGGGGTSQNKSCQFKLVLLGESAVGKSSLVLRFVKGQFHEYQESTIGGKFCGLFGHQSKQFWLFPLPPSGLSNANGLSGRCYG